MIELSNLSKTIDTLTNATDDELKLVFKHVEDVIVLTRIINLAAQQLTGNYYE